MNAVALILICAALAFCGCSRDLTVRTSPLPRDADAVELRAAAMTLSGEIFDTDGGRKGFVFVDEASAALVEGAHVVALRAGCTISQGLASILGAGGEDVEMGAVSDCGASVAMSEPAAAQPELMPEPMPPPKPADMDGDGIVDRDDRCVDVPQGPYPDPHHSGCPDPDTDGDGYTDSRDVCMLISAKPWPSSTRQGCPQPDSDGDGVGDEADLCKDYPAGPSPSEVKKGCPAPRSATVSLQPQGVSDGMGGFRVTTSFDYDRSRFIDGELTYSFDSLPPELRGAASYNMKPVNVSADIEWDAASPECAGVFGGIYWAGRIPAPIGSEMLKPCRSAAAQWVLGPQNLTSYSSAVPSISIINTGVGWGVQPSGLSVRLRIGGHVTVKPRSCEWKITATW